MVRLNNGLEPQNYFALVSPAVFDGNHKTAIDAKDLRTGNSRRLAVLHGDENTGLETKRWSFYPEVVSWGNQILKDSVPCDLLIVDELGSLEFIRQEGWINGFKAIESRKYRAAVVVIRPSLLGAANQHWEIFHEIDLDSPLSQSLTGEKIFNNLGFDSSSGE